MSSSHVFISHSTEDNNFATELRIALESHNLLVCMDTRELSGGHKLKPELQQKIEEARQVIVVVSLNALNSEWVQWEVEKALEVEARRNGDGYKVIPLMFPNIKPAALKLLFGEQPIGVKVELQIGGVNEALPHILTALGERLPDGLQSAPEPPATPVEELILKLSRPQLDLSDGKRRATAEARLVYEPSDQAKRNVESDPFHFTAPLGPIEAYDLRWYLEEFYRWPDKSSRARAKQTEEQLPVWGRMLFAEAVKDESAKEALEAWRGAASGAERRFSVLVDDRLLKDSSEELQAAAREAASLLLSLPWELLDDGHGYLFQGNHSVRVRRRLPNRRRQEVRPSSVPIRILLVSPRPEDARAGYIDHRISAKPLVEAIAELGALAAVTLLLPPTFAALQQELKRAAQAGRPYDVVHFDGHGIYNMRVGLGQLCFEDPKDVHLLDGRAMKPINPSELAAEMRAHRIPLVFLEACQSAKTDEDPTASVAAKLLEEGVTSVVAMTHSVLVETARRFVEAFYKELARGSRLGSAMLAGQHALFGDSYRGKVAGAGDLNLQDWFVPVLFQEANDPRLLTQLPSEQARQLQTERRRLSLGRLPAPPPHTFIGRSRELLRMERLLLPDAQPEFRYAVLRGVGGEGKTTLAAELARWILATNRFERVAFASFDPNDIQGCGDVRSLLDSLGKQLLPEGERWSVAEHEWKKAVQQVERALRDHPTILVLDNMESLLAGVSTGSVSDLPGQDAPSGSTALTADAQVADAPRTEPADEIFSLCQTLLRAHPATRIVFTSRESLPAPFDHRQREIPLGQLSREDAVELVSQVLRSEHRRLPEAEQVGGTAQAITDLVETANRHARALVRLTQELADRDLRSTTEDLRQALAALDLKHPGDRENSLYASVELSLRRLPPDQRQQVKALAVFHGGANMMILGYVIGVGKDIEAVQRLAAALIEVGLAEMMDYGHLRLDPALPAYLLAQTDAVELSLLTARWAEAMQALTGFLYQQHFQDAQLASQLTLLELRNLLVMLNLAADALPPEEVVDLADKVETMIARLGCPQALAQVVSMRAAAARRLGDWSHAQFLNASNNIDRLLEQGDLPSALAAAQQLLARCLSAGAEAYPVAAYDIAIAYVALGIVLRNGGAVEEARSLLTQSQHRFQRLADSGNASAANMVAITISETAKCLSELGRDDKAADAFEEAILRLEEIGNNRAAAANKGNLGRVRLNQKRFAEALERHTEALKLFELLSDPGSVAVAYHEIGRVHSEAGQFEQAERAFRQSLAIKVQQKDVAGEASSLIELGSLHNLMGRLEEAAIFYQKGTDIYVKMQNLAGEGGARTNLANTLIKLQRYDEARRELLRAIECRKPFRQAAEPWKTLAILHNLELATENAQAAAEARGQAVASYLAYRRAGGESQSNRASLFALVAQALQQGTTTEAGTQLTEYEEPDNPAWLTALLDKLQAVLRGDLDASLAADPTLRYDDAVELQLLLESL